MASGREERFLARQRGAGTRKLQDFGFEFDVPADARTPSNASESSRGRRSTSRAAQAEAARRTPILTPRQGRVATNITPRSTRSRTSQEILDSNARVTQTDENGSTTKRRRLSARSKQKSVSSPLVDDGNTLPEIEEEAGEGEHQAKDDVLPEIEEEPEEDGLQSGNSGAQPTAESSLENQAPSQDTQEKLGTGTLGAEYIEQSSSDLSELGEETASDVAKSAGMALEPTDEVNPKADEDTEHEVDLNSSPEGDAEQVTEQSERYGGPDGGSRLLNTKPKPLKPIHGNASKALGSPTAGPSRAKKNRRSPSSMSLPDEESVEEIVDDASGSEYEEIQSVAHESPPRKPRKGRPPSRGVSVTANAAAPQRKLKQYQPKSTTKAKPKANRKESRKVTAPSRQSERPSSPDDAPLSKSSGLKAKSIPITVHRIAHVHSLNFTAGKDDDLAGPAPFPKKSTVNAIDVLSQICRETVSKSIETLNQSANGERGEGKKAEWRRKRKVVEIFGDELEGRMLQMTIALDNHHALGVKIKQAIKDRNKARDALLDLRRQRQDIILEMDDVRLRHEKSAAAEQGETDLNNMLHDIELAVQKGRAAQRLQDPDADDEPIGLELRLRELTGTISSSGGHTGLLDRLKEFNELLERAIAVI